MSKEIKIFITGEVINESKGINGKNTTSEPINPPANSMRFLKVRFSTNPVTKSSKLSNKKI